MARSRVKLHWIQKRSSRKSAFKNRSAGLLTKVEELCILCGLPALLIIFNQETDLLTIWPSLQDAEELLQRFMSLPVYIRRKKMKDLQSFLDDRVTSMQEERTKLLKKINEMEMNNSIDQIERRGKLFNEFSPHKLTDLSSYLTEKMDKIKELIAFRTSNDKASPSLVGYEHTNSYDHIIGKIGKHPSASLFGSLKRQKGSSSNSIVMPQPNPCSNGNNFANNMELPLASNTSDEYVDFGISLDMSFDGDDMILGAIGGIDTDFNAGNEEGLLLDPIGGAKNDHDDEHSFDFTRYLRSSSSFPSLD